MNEKKNPTVISITSKGCTTPLFKARGEWGTGGYSIKYKSFTFLNTYRCINYYYVFQSKYFILEFF